nr:MAG TPA: hypothetical protein [Caudoviricetes sp.]
MKLYFALPFKSPKIIFYEVIINLYLYLYKLLSKHLLQIIK